ncbi:ATP-binding protein [Paenibacillus mesophilus]|uniref:ATP-binding protein n=1 Tax=Paenibacillus mesophilus TaxID=2582849 RepID=UPI0013051FB3|nr:ATP-binding protein [Paenibacillus mesophilus]
MLQRVLAVCLIGLIAISFIPLSIVWNNDKRMNDLQVRNGVMDLSEWNYEQNKRIKLDGEWEFYWDRLLTSDRFKQTGADKLSPSAFIKVPSQWNGKRIDGNVLPAHGVATYRMVLRNVPFDGVFAVKKTNIRFASTVYANGYKLFDDGKPSDKEAGYRAGNVPQIGFFPSGKGDVELIVQVANFDYANSGIPASLYFGEQSAMIAYQQKSKAHELGTFAILATLALIYVICFATAALYRNKDYSLLLFALFCIFYAIYNGLVGERVLLMYIPEISFELMFKIKDVCSMAGLIVLALYFYHLKKNMISLRYTQFVIVVLGIYVAMVAVLPIPVYQKVEPFVILVYESMIFWLLFRTAFHHIKSAGNERLNSFLLYLAILCFALYSVDLILFSFSLKENLWLGQFYMIAFNLIILFRIVLRFFEAYHTVDRMKNQLLRLDKIKDDFLSDTSHELKTPLNAIVNITDTIIRGVEGPVTDKQAHNLAIVMESGRRLTYLVNELLDYSKMKHGDIALYRSRIDLKAVVDSVIHIHLFLLGGKRVALVNKVPDHIPEIDADGNRLIQILHNLIGNAVKFTEHGEICVSAEVIRDKVEVRVADTGIGITEQMRERVFDAFEQAAASGTEYGIGTGLGLSITKKLVELHGGRIRVDSSPGQGSVFSFTMPLSPAAGISQGQADESERPQPKLPNEATIVYPQYPIYIAGEKEETILVVDDDFANLQTMINLFRLEGYPVVAVNRGQMALDELAYKPDFFLIVLDIMMPDMSGYEVLNRVRERFSSFELPVLMLTAKNRADDMAVSMENGANDFVGKPFEAEELMARVQSLTRLKASVKTAKDAEFAFLRSQINPHFLYNALNSIAELCVDEPRRAEELTLQLSQYLRSSFDFKQLDSLTTLQNELGLVQAYVHIEQARFGARLRVEYDVDADLDTRIPPLIVQPLVENAIKHGLMSNISGGNVIISVKEVPNAGIRIAVEDDGCGMSERKLGEVLRPNAENAGVGLWNISRRIKLLYGRSIRIETAEGKGTKVSFDIPVPSVGQKGG